MANIGIKDATPDFVVIASEVPCRSVAMFTRSLFAGPSVLVSRRNAAGNHLQAVVVVSKNANVATGAEGLANAEELGRGVAVAAGCDESEVLVTSTGVIGRQYPMERISAHLSNLAAAAEQVPADKASRAAASSAFDTTDAVVIASAMMTTDTHPKTASATLPTVRADGTAGTATVVGMAKGVGMIEPDMATMLSFVLTDAELPVESLDRVFRQAVDRSLNSLSVDTDTSTSDTAALRANGLAGTAEEQDFAAAVNQVCTELTLRLDVQRMLIGNALTYANARRRGDQSDQGCRGSTQRAPQSSPPS